MKKLYWITGIILVILISAGILIYNMLQEPTYLKEEEEILDKFNGYDWSWWCFDYEVKFTLWTEHLEKIEKRGNYWIIEGFSSDRDDSTKSISPDKSGKVLFIYEKESDKIIDWTHGEDIPLSPEIDEEGNIINERGLIYC